MNSYHPQGKYYHIVVGKDAIIRMIARKGNAKKTAATIPGAVIVEAAGRAELYEMGYTCNDTYTTPAWTPVAPGVYEVKDAGR